MNGLSGFQEVWSFISRSRSGRLLHEQQHQFGTGSWHLFPLTISSVTPQAAVQSEKRLPDTLSPCLLVRMTPCS